MSLSIAYESIEDAQMRLQGTVVLYDGDPVYITSIHHPEAGDPKEDIYRVYAAPLPYNGRGDAEKFRKFISSRKFDMAPFPMGFMNYDNEVYYCTRLPRRQQQQGLSSATFSAECISNPAKNIRFENLLSKDEFVNCIKGNFPSFKEVIDRLTREEQALAFDRSFAAIKDPDIDELIYLYHKREKVGFIMEGRLKLSKQGKCLAESLREVGVEC